MKNIKRAGRGYCCTGCGASCMGSQRAEEHTCEKYLANMKARASGVPQKNDYMNFVKGKVNLDAIKGHEHRPIFI